MKTFDVYGATKKGFEDQRSLFYGLKCSCFLLLSILFIYYKWRCFWTLVRFRTLTLGHVGINAQYLHYYQRKLACSNFFQWHLWCSSLCKEKHGVDAVMNTQHSTHFANADDHWMKKKLLSHSIWQIDGLWKHTHSAVEHLTFWGDCQRSEKELPLSSVSLRNA